MFAVLLLLRSGSPISCVNSVVETQMEFSFDVRLGCLSEIDEFSELRLAELLRTFIINITKS